MKKRLLALIIMVLLLMQSIGLAGFSVSATTVEKDTSENEYYTLDELYPDYTAIYTKEDLDNIRSNPSGKYYLANDITFEDSDFEEGGDFYNEGYGWKPIEEFSGVLDGVNYKINNLKISSEKDNKSLSFIIKNTGSIKNLTIDINLNMKFEQRNDDLVKSYGTFSSLNCGNISCCTASGTMFFEEEDINKVSNTSIYIGGISGISEGNISICKSSVNINVNCTVIESKTNTNCYSASIGGICGYNSSVISDCYNEGNILKAQASVHRNIFYDNIGAICGIGYGTVKYCYNIGDVKRESDTMDIAGYWGINVISSYSNCEGMKSKSTYINWDFDNIWNINEGNDYPRFRENSSYFPSGDGTLDNPFVVSSVKQLFYINYFKDSSFVLENDLIINESDCSEEFMPEYKSDYQPTFNGVFNGNNHTIKVKKFFNYGKSYIALPFAKNNNGTIKNLTVSFDVTQGILHDSITDVYIAALTEQNSGLIENCSILGEIKIDSNDDISYGGFSIYNKKNINSCRNNCNIKLELTNKNHIMFGGITVENKISATICGCSFSGNLNSSVIKDYDGSPRFVNTNIGGICAFLWGSTSTDKEISQCCFDGTIFYDERINSNPSSELKSIFGGIVGAISQPNDVEIENCMSIGNIHCLGTKTKKIVASIVGLSISSSSTEAYKLKLINCYASDSLNYENTDGSFNHVFYNTNSGKLNVINCYIANIDLNINNGANEDQENLRTNEQMKDQTTYEGFDFENVWEMGKYDNFYYPTLRGLDCPKIRTLGLYVQNFPEKQSFKIDEDFDSTGLKVAEVTNGGSISEITDYKCFLNPYAEYGENTVYVVWSKNAEQLQRIKNCETFEDFALMLNDEDSIEELYSTELKINLEPKELNSYVSYNTHVQDFGWMDYVKDGELSGTTGLCKRLEGIHIYIQGEDNLGVTYSTHVQDYGWQDFVSDGEMSGTSGQCKRLEAIKIELTGEDAEYFDIYYRVHVQDYGWLGWAENGAAAGTEGLSKRLESIEIMIFAKDTADVDTVNPFISGKGLVTYQTHVEDYGWQGNMKDGEISGTTGEAKRLEGIEINLNSNLPQGDIYYTTHVQDYGWLDWSCNGEMSGTTGESKRLEAIAIELDGEIAEEYDIYYRVHAQEFGWLGWARNGEIAGTSGLGYRLEAIEIQLVPKGQEVPGYGDYSYIYA